MEVAESLVKKIKRTHRQPRDRSAVRPVAIPYMHSITPNPKKVANQYDIPVVFSAPNKLSRLCRKINSPTDTAEKCKKFTKCTTGVVYEIPMSCGSVYTDQTGQCFNDGAREHDAATNAIRKSGHALQPLPLLPVI